MRLLKFISSIAVILCLPACKERFVPPDLKPGATYLIVEGVLNAGADSTHILITRSVPVESRNLIRYENTAVVKVEGRDNSVRLLERTGQGRYSSAALGLVIGNEYRLHIRLSDGKEYASAFVKARKTPVIDSIGLKPDASGLNGLHGYVNAKDVSGETRYYRWEYEETWEINSFYNSSLIYQQPRVRDRIFPQEEVFRCWKNANSTSILISSSVSLEADVIFQKPLTFFPFGDERLAVRYSMLLRQYALDKDAYLFYDLMRKNTESIGTVFDPQPADIRGNMTCITDPKEPVLGYIVASTVEQKRIFVDRPNGWVFSEVCTPPIEVTMDSLQYYFGGGYMPTDEWYDEVTGGLRGYYGAPPSCVDCRVRGGDKRRPSFW